MNLHYAKENVLKIQDMDGLRKSKEGICAAEEFPCSADDRADFEVMDRIGMQSCSAGPKKRRYLRNQLLSFRETLSDEEWLRYAEFRFGTAMKKQPFVKRRFPEVSSFEIFDCGMIYSSK